ncbi:hypothetical protein Q5752_000490 [Cryptotrichosporon argae]
MMFFTRAMLALPLAALVLAAPSPTVDDRAVGRAVRVDATATVVLALGSAKSALTADTALDAATGATATIVAKLEAVSSIVAQASASVSAFVSLRRRSIRSKQAKRDDLDDMGADLQDALGQVDDVITALQAEAMSILAVGGLVDNIEPFLDGLVQQVIAPVPSVVTPVRGLHTSVSDALDST